MIPPESSAAGRIAPSSARPGADEAARGAGATAPRAASPEPDWVDLYDDVDPDDCTLGELLAAVVLTIPLRIVDALGRRRARSVRPAHPPAFPGEGGPARLRCVNEATYGPEGSPPVETWDTFAHVRHPISRARMLVQKRAGETRTVPDPDFPLSLRARVLQAHEQHVAMVEAGDFDREDS